MPKKRQPSQRQRRSIPRFKSKFERAFYEATTAKGYNFRYEAEGLPYSLHLLYKPDWKVRDGLYIETKGKFDYSERRKILAVKECNPDKDIRMVFMRNQKLGKGSKMTYGDWCDKHDIKWSVFPKLPLEDNEL